jgi:methionyl-tRNA formyltransferase
VVVCAYGVIVPAPLLGERLWLNVHPSLLPRWRGAAPVERAIMAGDTETGVTIHRTTPELDAGPVAARRSFPIGPEDDAGAVFGRASAVAVELLDEALPDPRFHPQETQGVTYAEKITAADRELDWSRPVAELLGIVRALSPHIGARGVIGGRRLTVWRARPAGHEARLVAGGLELLEVQPEGRRRMTAAEYLRGLRSIT